MGLEARRAAEKESPISDYIPYSQHVSESVITTKKGEYLSVWKIGGREHQSKAWEEIRSWTDELNNVLRGIGGSANLALWTHIVRRRVFEYPESQFSNVFCRQLDDRYRASFEGSNTMVNDLYLTVILRPQTDSILGWFAKGEKLSVVERTERQVAAIKSLDEVNKTLGAALRRYSPELLGIYDKDGFAYSSAVEFLAQLVNGQRLPMPICRGRLSDNMALNRPFFSTHGELGEIRSANMERRFGMIEIGEYPDHSAPGQLNGLLESDFEFVLSQSFTTLSRHAARGFLQRHQRNLLDSRDVASGQIDEITDALDQLVSGHFVMGEHHASLLVFGDTPNQVRDNLAEAGAMLLDVAVIPKTLDLALEAAFWAQLPGNWTYRPRPAPITSQNFLSFSPFHNFHTGKATNNPWGPAVTMFKTTSGTPLYFSFHASKGDEDATDKRLLGNTMLIGQSGAGKTVLLGFLLAQAQKFDPTIVAFDKDRGMEIALRAMGGRYLPLQNGRPSGFNPFQMEGTPANLMFLKQFVVGLVTSGGHKVTHQDEVEIEKAVTGMMTHIDRADRRLSTLLQSLPNPHDPDAEHPTVHARLLKWTSFGELGWLFDNEVDALDLSSHKIYGFDITDFLDNPETRGAVMMYLIYRTEGMIDGRKFLYVFDEFWKALEDPYFVDLVKNKQKTIRKQNGVMVFATQEPGDALQSDIAKTLVQQCATFILLPNPKADEADYRDGFKLTATEFERVKGLGESSRRFLIKQGEASAVAELDLGGFDDELLVLSGTPDNAERVQALTALHGDDPEIWLPRFLASANGKLGDGLPIAAE